VGVEDARGEEEGEGEGWKGRVETGGEGDCVVVGVDEGDGCCFLIGFAFVFDGSVC
jgi:hypothetical protein